jgi:hypothetical protein
LWRCKERYSVTSKTVEKKVVNIGGENDQASKNDDRPERGNDRVANGSAKIAR